MRIVQFIDTLRSGGKERQFVELLKGLVGEPGIEVEVIIMSETVHYDYLDTLDITTHSLLRNSKYDPTIFFRLYKLLKNIQPDILHSWSHMCSVYALPIVKLLGIKFVNGFLRNAPPVLSIKNKEWICSKFTFPFSDAIVANSHAGLLAYRAPIGKSSCIHNGIDFSRFESITKAAKVRQQYNISTKYVVGMVATFSDRKDYTTFLEAATSILIQRNDVTFVAVGDGPNLEVMKSRIKPAHSSFIRLLGKQKRVEEIINIFTIGVLTSNAKTHGEGVSNTIMEYMALKKPVVATDCGGNRELLVDGKTGYLIQNNDSQGLVERLLDFIEHPDKIGQFGVKGEQRIKEKFNLDALTKAHLRLYESISDL